MELFRLRAIGQESSVDTPVKNTFIHYDEPVEAPSKLRRVSSAPAAFRSSGEVNKENAVPSEAPRVNEAIEDQNFAPARKKARVVSSEDGSCASSKQLSTDQGEDQSEYQGQVRGRSKTRSSSRLQPRAEEGGNANNKELSEQERFERAKEWVSKMKDTAGYKSYLKNRIAGDKAALAAPRTPDPTLRISSKRKWERAIMSWRISLRRWGSVTVSAEDESR